MSVYVLLDKNANLLHLTSQGWHLLAATWDGNKTWLETRRWKNENFITSFTINFVANLFVFFLAMTTRAVAESSADARKTGREREWTRVYNKVESEKDVFTHHEVFWISYPLSARLFRDGNHEPVQGTTRKIELRAWNEKNFVSGLPRFWIGTDLWTIFCRRKFNPCKHFGRVTGDAIIFCYSKFIIH